MQTADIKLFRAKININQKLKKKRRKDVFRIYEISSYQISELCNFKKGREMK
jgi:hypothetical protein